MHRQHSFQSAPTRRIAVGARRLFTGVLLAGAVGFAGNGVAADSPSAKEIVERANLASYYAGEDGRSEARMRIVDERGRTQTRQFTILRKDVEDGGVQHYLVVFSRPSEYRGVAFLVEKQPEGDDDRWLYLPDQDLDRRIAPGDKRTSFVGSHVFYEDVSGRRIDDDTHELVETTAEHYVLRSTPKEGDAVEFAAYTTYVDRQTDLPLITEYEDANGEVYRRVESDEVESFQGHPTPMRMRIEDQRMGGFTEVQFRGQEYDVGLDDDVFSHRSLRNPPREWLGR